MNSEKLARTTFVIDRDTHDQLSYISRRMGVSRSELIRDVIGEPVALMAKWVLSVPDQPTAEDAARIGDVLQLDIVEFLSRKAEEVRHSGILEIDPADVVK